MPPTLLKQCAFMTVQKQGVVCTAVALEGSASAGKLAVRQCGQGGGVTGCLGEGIRGHVRGGGGWIQGAVICTWILSLKFLPKSPLAFLGQMQPNWLVLV